MEHHRQSVQITVRRGDKILAVNNRRWGGFSCPGGKIDGAETPEQAARRELLEETGCTALHLKSLGGHLHDALPKDENKRKWFCNAFDADIGDQEPKAAEDGTRPFWTTPDDLLKNSLYPDWYRWLFSKLKM